MKFFLAILSIAMMAQASMAGSLGRVKRADEVEQAAHELYEITQEILGISVQVAQKVYEAIPKTEEYAKHRQNIKAYLDVYHELAAQKGKHDCLQAFGTLLKALFNLFENFDHTKEPTSEEIKGIKELFTEFGGEKLVTAIEEFETKYYNEAFFQKFSSYNKEDIENWGFLKEKC